jgi:hypothetical protein
MTRSRQGPLRWRAVRVLGDLRDRDLCTAAGFLNTRLRVKRPSRSASRGLPRCQSFARLLKDLNGLTPQEFIGKR